MKKLLVTLTFLFSYFDFFTISGIKLNDLSIIFLQQIEYER